MRRILPRPLRKGDVIAIVAPGGPVDRERLSRGLARLSSAGFVPETAAGLLRREGYLAGNDRHRAAQMEWALTHPAAQAVMAARGGYGTARLLPLIDWRRAAAHPRLLIGYSDVTAVLAYVSTRLRKASDEPVGDRVGILSHDDRYCRGCLLERTGYCGTVGYDNSYFETN